MSYAIDMPVRRYATARRPSRADVGGRCGIHGDSHRQQLLRRCRSGYDPRRRRGAGDPRPRRAAAARAAARRHFAPRAAVVLSVVAADDAGPLVARRRRFRCRHLQPAISAGLCGRTSADRSALRPPLVRAAGAARMGKLSAGRLFAHQHGADLQHAGALRAGAPRAAAAAALAGGRRRLHFHWRCTRIRRRSSSRR